MTTLNSAWRAAVTERAARQRASTRSIAADGFTIAVGDTVLHVGCATETPLRFAEIVRITAIGIFEENREPLPNCLSYEYLGVRGRHSNCFNFPHRHNFLDFGSGQSDKCYFQPWDGNGVLFNTPKADRLLALILREHELWNDRAAKGRVAHKDSRDHIEHQIQTLLDTPP